MLSYEIDLIIVAGVAIFLALILYHGFNCQLPKCKDTKNSIKNSKKQKIKSIYPPLEDSESLELSSSEDSELSTGEEEDLKEAAAEYEAERSGPIGRSFSAPPPTPPYADKKAIGNGHSFCTPKGLQKICQAFPVFQDHAQQRYYEPISHKQVKELAESVRTYGVNASFTQSQIDRLAHNAMTPFDWMSVVKACLTMGQYLDWKSIWHDLCLSQARANATAGQQAWSFEMLTGQGIWTNNQLGYPVQVYDQINQAAVKAWKALPNRGEVSGNLTKIIQGINEPFSEFVARMMEAAGRIFGDAEAAMPLIEQLVYEQCTKECRNAITPWKGKGLQAWMKACREIGGPLSNAGLAAAVLMAQTKEITCYNCGQTGHMQKQCTKGRKSRFEQTVPVFCPKCWKGRHWANECRSVRDIKGRPIPQFKVQQPKNGVRGPRPQGPQMYGAFQTTVSMRPPRDRGEPLRVQQDWTSVPPPE